jgi:hypothetical protein
MDGKGHRRSISSLSQTSKAIAMRPYIICHMLSSVDGKIDGAALGAVTGDGEYEATAAGTPC